MIRLKVRLPIQAHDAQHRGHSTFVYSKYGAKQQYQYGLENPLGKQKRKCEG